nr:MAG TPA: hypothetical protein [Caudoviricetes sp.]
MEGAGIAPSPLSLTHGPLKRRSLITSQSA